MAKVDANLFPKVIFVEDAAPATPAAGTVIEYAKADGLIYSKDDAGTETLVSGGSGAGVLPWAIVPYYGMIHIAYQVVGAANRAIYVPVVIPAAGTITGLRYRVGTQNGNICVGLYTAAGSRVATSGAVACPASGLASTAFTSSYAAAAGRYYLALSADNNTATFSCGVSATTDATPATARVEDTAHPLPVTATFGVETGRAFNFLGLVSGGFPT